MLDVPSLAAFAATMSAEDLRGACGPYSMDSAGVQTCIICLESDPPPIQSGCACRSDTGLAHVGCLIETAVAQRPHRGAKVWWECQTCGQHFTGAMRTGLAEALWSRVCDEAEESAERLAAADNLAHARKGQGRYAEAERIIRQVLGVRRRVLGEEHPETLTSANNLASSLAHQGKHAEAEEMLQAALAARRRVLGSAQCPPRHAQACHCRNLGGNAV